MGYEIAFETLSETVANHEEKTLPLDETTMWK